MPIDEAVPLQSTSPEGRPDPDFAQQRCEHDARILLRAREAISVHGFKLTARTVQLTRAVCQIMSLYSNGSSPINLVRCSMRPESGG
jgi:hypothetical protein